MTGFVDLNAMDEGALQAALSGPPEAVAALLRVAAEGGAVEAQLRLGQILLDGRGVARDPGGALRWFGLAAKAGHAMGMNMVGRCIEHGWGTTADKGQAAAWYRAAADRGLDWGMYNLATLLALGSGIAEDRREALALFQRAGAMGHAKSLNMVGSFHEDGWAVPPDRAKAAAYYERAAQGGDFRGQFNHARMLIEDGLIEEALPWLRRLARTATPSFLVRVRAWLHAHADRRLRQFTLDDSGPSAYANGSH